TFLLAEFGEAAAGCVPLLVAEVVNPATPEERRGVRCAAALALGRIGAATDVDEAEATLAGAVGGLTPGAGDPAESQPLRSYCIEALMDIGPPARSAIPVLERVFRDDEDEDLRNFACSALKSVGIRVREHPCGGTMAEHMRSLYRAE